MLKVFERVIQALRSLENVQGDYTMSREMRERFRSPMSNVNGNPMVGRYDIRGQEYGSSRFDSSKF